MNAVIFVVVLIFVFIFPVLIAFKVMHSLKQSGDKTILRLVVVVTALGLVYFVYSAFYPTDGICIDKYERYTELRFPNSGKIVAKDASIMDKGSFRDCFLVQMNNEDYKKALNEIISNHKFFPHDSFLVYTEPFRKVKEKAGNGRFSRVFSDGSKAYIFVGFLDDQETVMVNIVARQSAYSKLPPVSNHQMIFKN